MGYSCDFVLIYTVRFYEAIYIYLCILEDLLVYKIKHLLDIVAVVMVSNGVYRSTNWHDDMEKMFISNNQ